MAWAFLHRFKSEWKLLAPLLLAAAAGMGFGWYYYWDVGQFRPGHEFFVQPWLWPVVSDSPNAVLVWVIAAVSYKVWARRWWWLDGLAFLLNVYIGLWTTTVFLLYPDTMRTFDWASVPDGNANPVLFVSHMGMPLLALVMAYDLRRDRIGWRERSIMVVAMAAYVAVDYWGPHLHPAPFLHRYAHDASQLHAVAPWLMVVAVATWLAVTWPSKAVRA